MSKLTDAEEFLRRSLANGPRLAIEVKEAAGDWGIALPTLERARAEIGVRSDKARVNRGRWHWTLEGDSAGKRSAQR